MAIREKLKKTFGRKKEGKDGVSGSSTPSTSSEKHFTGRTDIEYYKPHEIPKSKYRGKVDPEHKETLESYSFADALASMRRRSSQALSGIVSPGGTKSQSRRPSYMSRASSTDVRSNNFAGGENVPSRQNTTTTASHLPPGMALVRENSDDDTDPVNGKQTLHSVMFFFVKTS